MKKHRTVSLTELLLSAVSANTSANREPRSDSTAGEGIALQPAPDECITADEAQVEPWVEAVEVDMEPCPHTRISSAIFEFYQRGSTTLLAHQCLRCGEPVLPGAAPGIAGDGPGGGP